jgi:genome maintenance exonuclease 1
MFRHDLIELPTLERIDGSPRLYQTPEGKLYPSVTSILGKTMEKGEGLQKWIDAVGKEQAETIMMTSGVRGDDIHQNLENFVLNREVNEKKIMPINRMMYRQIKDFLVENVDDIRLSEGRLYSDVLKVAGSVDLVASYKGKFAIIDFKTARRLKEEAWILGYFYQTALYSYMMWERTGIFCNTLVIVIAVENEYHPQIFVRKATDYIEAAKELCVRYHNELT